jgi:hypothetical protein
MLQIRWAKNNTDCELICKLAKNKLICYPLSHIFVNSVEYRIVQLMVQCIKANRILPLSIKNGTGDNAIIIFNLYIEGKTYDEQQAFLTICERIRMNLETEEDRVEAIVLLQEYLEYALAERTNDNGFFDAVPPLPNILDYPIFKIQKVEAGLLIEISIVENDQVVKMYGKTTPEALLRMYKSLCTPCNGKYFRDVHLGLIDYGAVGKIEVPVYRVKALIEEVEKIIGKGRDDVLRTA